MFLNVLRRGRAVPLAAAFAVGAITMVSASQPPVPPSTAAQKTPAKPTADAPLPPAREIIDRFVQAIGGRDAVLSHKSMHAVGTFSMPSAGVTGTLENFTASNPDRALLRVSIPGLGEIAQGYDGERGWRTDPMTGPTLQEGKELQQAKLDADFYSELRDPKRYRSITTVEKTAFDGRPCYKISLVRPDGGEDFDFYDVETGLRAGTIVTRESPMGTVTATNVEGNYKKFGNLMQATTLTTRTMGVEQKITVATIEYDSVPASAFEPPAAIKALIK